MRPQRGLWTRARGKSADAPRGVARRPVQAGNSPAALRARATALDAASARLPGAWGARGSITMVVATDAPVPSWTSCVSCGPTPCSPIEHGDIRLARRQSRVAAPAFLEPEQRLEPPRERAVSFDPHQPLSERVRPTGVAHQDAYHRSERGRRRDGHRVA